MEKFIKENREKFMEMPREGHQGRFAIKMQAEMNRKNKVRQLWLGISSAAAAVTLFFILMNQQDIMRPYIYEENDKVAEVRMVYEKQLDETIMLLENILPSVDDSTRNEINKVIESLSNTYEVFVKIAPLPEEKQLAITTQMYGLQLQTLNSIYRKISAK